MPRHLRTAERYYRFSARLARRAATRARRENTFAGVAAVVVAHQMTTAREAPLANAAILLEQSATVPRAEASIDPIAFTTPTRSFEAMLAQIERDIEAQVEAEAKRLETDFRFSRLVESIVQETARAAQSVDIAARPHVEHVRHLNLPSCSRCAVLAGRVYRYSEGFRRHPGCDCVMIPVTVASPDLTHDPEQLARDGLVRGLSAADLQAIEDGADFGKVVNVHNRKAGLAEAGQVLARAGRPTPAAIYGQATTREEAVDLLRQAKYLR